MSTPIKRIEKDFLFKIMYDEQVPIMYRHDRKEYILKLKTPNVRNELTFEPDRPVKNLKLRAKMDLMFDYRGSAITFSVGVDSFKDDLICCKVPEALHKNLDRAYSRINSIPEMQMQFMFLGDRYNLSFPEIAAHESTETPQIARDIDPKNLSGLMTQMATWSKGYTDGYKMVIFKDGKPSTPEEVLITGTGKTLYLPSTKGGFPQGDPYPVPRIITEEIFKQYLENTGVEEDFLASACDRFVKKKLDAGIFSDAWVPMIFQKYVIGYIHIWTTDEKRPPFDYGVLDTIYQFTKILAYSLKVNGYFDKGKIKNESFEGKVIDISVSGALFAYPISTLSSTLLTGSELAMLIITPKRNVNAKAKIVRSYKDNSLAYFGCCFKDLAPEDSRFLFEYLYGKTFTDNDAMFLTGQV